MNTPAEHIISRQAADIRSLKASTAALLEAKHKEMAEARLWFDKAQEAFAEIEFLRTQLREARNKASEPAGLLLAVGMILTRPVDDANRVHFAKRCAEAASAITPGLGAPVFSLLKEAP